MNFFYLPQPTRIWPSSSLFQTTLASSPHYIGEIKLNGWRLELHKQSEALIFYNKHGTIINTDPRPFLRAFSDVPDGSIFDGELVDKRTKDTKNVIVFWDCMFWGDRDIRNLPLSERKKFLEPFEPAPEKITSGSLERGLVYHIRQHKQDLVKFYETTVAKDDPLEEGIVVKDLHSKYEYSPRRSFNTARWFKIKKIQDSALIGRER